MANCKKCIHEKICLHKVNIQNDTYSKMGIKYETENCKHYTPTADAAEVKHGHWLGNAQTDDYSCSECGGMAPVDCEKEDFYESNYCPNCGAKMYRVEKI